MSAGENTLEAQLARLLTRTLAADLTEKKTQQSNFLDSFRSKYVDFMTTPGNHRDTYASTCHRMFFANWADGVAPEKCPDNDGHNVDSIDLLTLTVPVILRYADASAEVRNKKVLDTIAVTRKTSRSMDRFAKAYATMLSNVVKGASLRDEAEAAYKSLGGRYTMKEAVASSYGDPMTACYMNSSFPALLHFAYKYADSPEEAILANANAGGENVARGSLLGALMGAAHGLKAFPAWSHKLHEYDSIMGEIDAFASALPEPSSPSVMSKY